MAPSVVDALEFVDIQVADCHLVAGTIGDVYRLFCDRLTD